MRLRTKGVLLLIAFAGTLYAWMGEIHPHTAQSVEEAVLPKSKAQKETRSASDQRQMVQLKRTDGSVEEIELEAYLKGVVGSEMTPSYEEEALKAQAVAARTFVASRNYQVDDSTASQVYMDESQLKAVWKSAYEESRTRIEAAVDATKGEIMVVDGKPITAFFFASSGGHTANAQEYYSTETSYLKSVDSPWDEQVDADYISTLTCTRNELAQALGLKNADAVGEARYYESGYVEGMTIGGVWFSGREVREALQLKSSCFTVSEAGNTITFTVKGSGHGVGMSQEGAQGMALAGYDYAQILRHYYTGITLTSVYKSES